MDKLIITVAPHVRDAVLDAHPEVPHTPEQIADEVVRSAEAGAAIAHLHVLDEAGHTTAELGAFRRTLELIRERCDVLIEGSTGGLIDFAVEERSVALETDIVLASLNPGSVNFDVHHTGRGVYVNPPQDIDYWVQQMHEKKIKPTVAIFEVGMIENALRYARRGLIAEPLFFNFVVGVGGALPAKPRNLTFLVDTIPPGSPWYATGHEESALEAAAWSIAMGGHARGGFEDTLDYTPGERATSSAQQVERLARIARAMGREIASPAEAHSILGIPRPASA